MSIYVLGYSRGQDMGEETGRKISTQKEEGLGVTETGQHAPIFPYFTDPLGLTVRTQVSLRGEVSTIPGTLVTGSCLISR